jgi:TetR/AcrR family transcriptional regulator, regulator of biofilm formation and stress response
VIAVKDRRRLRGNESRERLLEATLAVIEADGMKGLSHRAITARAGASLASASYHFEGLDDLVLSALEVATERLAESLRNEEGRDLDALARLLARQIADDRRLLIAEYELCILAVREPHLRGPAMAWLDVIADTFAAELTGVQRRAFQAVVEGVCLHSLFRETPPDAEEIAAILKVAWPG